MKTKIFREGDKGIAMCESCASKVTTTYLRREVPLNDDSDVVKDVMVGVCDQCDDIVMMPHQSVPRVKQVIAKKRKPLEARVPSHIKDMLLMVNYELEQTKGFEQFVVLYYLNRWATCGVPMTRLRRYRRNELFHGKANSRLSFKFRGIDRILERIHEASGELNSTTELLKAIIFTAYDDAVENPHSRAASQLKAIAEVHG